MFGDSLGYSKMFLLSLRTRLDHKPLEGIFEKALFEVVSPPLQCLREKVSTYSFQVKWVPGITHSIADGLSCAPLFCLI